MPYFACMYLGEVAFRAVQISRDGVESIADVVELLALLIENHHRSESHTLRLLAHLEHLAGGRHRWVPGGHIFPFVRVLLGTDAIQLAQKAIFVPFLQVQRLCHGFCGTEDDVRAPVSPGTTTDAFTEDDVATGGRVS